jgi:phage-related minor tail protein
VLLTERVTGQSADEIVKDFARMKEGVTKWAEEHNRSMHFISAAQYEQIRALEDQGRQTEAMSQVMAAYNDRLQDTQHQLGYVAKAYIEVKQRASEFLDAIGHLGKPQTVDDALADAQKRLQMLKGVASGQALPAFGEWLTPDSARQQIAGGAGGPAAAVREAARRRCEGQRRLRQAAPGRYRGL